MTGRVEIAVHMTTLTILRNRFSLINCVQLTGKCFINWFRGACLQKQ
ncbi:hypothetical protein MNBD_NITROSPINAE04-2414 [hydrothermal vent metagenome]|uniref:Uncharacterized protein n=1 Tax=hydrothermal vent metagenome TaxID=652676 RepID=A0A3B1CBM1_9ZZZZ